MSKANSYADRLKELDKFGEQVKEIAMPLLLDVGAGLTGWISGKMLQRKSLLIGGLIFLAGRYHSLRMAMRHERLREVKDSADNRISRLIGKVYGDKRIYYGESPFTTLGMAMMIGGASSFIGAKVANPQDKGVWQEIKEDLKHRLYLDNFSSKQDESTQAEQTVNGIGELNYFLAGDKLTQGMKLSVLDELDKEMEQAAVNFQNGETNGFAASQFQTPVSMSGFGAIDVTEEVGTRIL